MKEEDRTDFGDEEHHFHPMSSLSQVQRITIQYFHGTILILGAVGCTINAILFRRRHLKTSSCSIYFVGSALCGLVLLSIGIISQLYALYTSFNPYVSNRGFCKARTYLNQTSAMSCRWFLVMTCVDRWILSSRNDRFRSIATKRVARWIARILVLLWFILPVHTLIYSNIQPSNSTTCSLSPTGVAVYHRLYTIMLGGVLPTLLAGICSYHLWRNFRERQQQRLVIMCHRAEWQRRIREQQVLLMLLFQVIIFFISTIPFMSFNIYETLTQSITNKSSEQKSTEASIKTIVELLIYLITLSFYSNTLVSRTFRKEFLVWLNLTLIKRCRHRTSQVAPSRRKTPSEYLQTAASNHA